MRPYMRPHALAFMTAFLLTGCTTDSDPEATIPSPTATRAPTTDGAQEPTGLEEIQVIAQNLNAPWSIAFVDRTPVISERDTARIIALDENGASRELTTVEDTASTGEGGLLGITVHDNHLFAYLTTASDNRIIRYELTGEPGALALNSPDVIFAGIPAAGYHNGGRIAFGPDDMLYITTGDAQEPSEAQDLDSLAGKILRITADGEIPADNPFEDSPVYSYGHRNPQGVAWAEDGTLYSSEFGEDAWDELNVIEPGGNYGWPEVEGIGGADDSIDPVQQWQPAESSPSAIEIHDGETLFMAALRGQRLWEVPLSDINTSTAHLTGEFGRLRDVTTGPDGSLWILTNNTDGVGEPSEGDDRLLRVNP